MSERAIEIKGIAKSFFGVPVLESIDFRASPGEAIGLVGENGAGKSTLLNIISGLFPPDDGRMTLAGSPYAPANPRDALARGVALVHQELNLFANLTIAENIRLAETTGNRKQRPTRESGRGFYEDVARDLAKIGLKADPHDPIQRLSAGERQLVEIVKALRSKPRVLLLDEPTTSLTDKEVQNLFSMIEASKSQGIAIVYISHNLGHVKHICDQVVVLRDGVMQAKGPTADFDKNRLISLMIGRQIDQYFPTRATPPADEGAPQRRVVLEAQRVTQPGIVSDVSFKLHAGEVLGLSGLMGSGRTELARLLFGLEPFSSGQIMLHGEPLRPNPRRCIDRGMALVTENRREDGLLLDSSIQFNATLAALRRFAIRKTGWFQAAKANQTVQPLVDRLGVKRQSLETQAVLTLSGGNQQKTVLAKWLLTNPSVVILDEPTRGIDVGAKQDIYLLVNELVNEGAGVLLISSEMEELVGMCDRILVMATGEIRYEVTRDRFDREEILCEAFGEERLG